MAYDYNNFVKATSTNVSLSGNNNLTLDGEEVKRMYLEEIGQAKNEPVVCKSNITEEIKGRTAKNQQTLGISDQDIFLAVQNNDTKTLVHVLDFFPNKINLVDNYGWSLLMIACQANAVCTVKELLKRGVNTSVHDKAGNSAQSLIIASKNFQLAELLLKNNNTAIRNSNEHPKVKLKQKYVCEICNGQIFPDKEEHLVSTIHNLNASKGKKILTNYAIPVSNKGYQIMLKVGWDKEQGLGPLGSGKKYPIKAVLKKDKRGLGHKEKKEAVIKDFKQVNKKILLKQNEISRRQEITFRREFY